MHNTAMHTITEVTFGEIVTSLIQRVEEFENLLEKMSGEGTQKPE
jgi:hypothetical protein